VSIDYLRFAMIRRANCCGLPAVLLVLWTSHPDAQLAPFSISVVAGEDAVNIIQQKTAVAPVVEVRDRNGFPVAGVSCVFTIEGNSAAFGSGLKTVTVITDSAGRATSGAVTPLARGAVKIQVSARFQSQQLAATINQSNVATATAAPAAGGGMTKTMLITSVVGAGGAAALVSTDVLSRENKLPEICQGSTGSNDGIAALTEFVMIAEGCDLDNDPLTMLWDLGDGTTATTKEVRHTYAHSGDYTVSVTVNDGKETSRPFTFTNRVRSLTGRWLVNNSADYFEFTQSGTTVTGTYLVPNTGRVGTVSGALSNPELPRLILTLMSGLAAGTGSFNAQLGTFQEGRFTAFINGGGYANGGYVFTRQ
jgi:PKD domain